MKVEAVSTIPSPTLPSELSKNVKINLTSGATKEKVLAEVKQLGPALIKFISEKQ